MIVFERMMEGLDQAARHAAGEDVPGLVVHVPPTLDVAKIRAKTGMSQPAFADTVGVKVATLRGWEQGRRAPEGPARVLLAMVDRNPRIVVETLGTVPVAKPRGRNDTEHRGPKRAVRRAG